ISERPATRVLHLTDPHLFAAADGELRGVVTAASLGQVLDHYRNGGWKADIVIASGDLVQDDSADAYRRLATELGALELPVLAVPGNHDVPEIMREVLPAPPFRLTQTTAIDDWLIAGIDTQVVGRASGAVSEAEFERFEADLAAAEQQHALVFMHHAPVDVGSLWLDSVGMDQAAAVLDRLTGNAKVRVILFGHVHQAYDAMHGNVRVLGTPSTCRQFKPHSDNYAVDDRPPAYRQLELGPDGQFETRLIWT
ncbi:MAG: metallophosphoesterase, partial [Pseudomonadota bacterium]